MTQAMVARGHEPGGVAPAPVLVRGNRATQRAAVLRLLAERPRTQTDMVKPSGLSQPMMTRVVRDLVNDGLVRSLGKAESNGGRRAVVLGLQPDAVVVMGIRLARGEIGVSLVNLGGDEVDRHIINWTGARLARDTIAHALQSMLETLPTETRLAGASVAVPGVADPRSRTVSEAPDLGWTQPVQLEAFLAERLGVPVLVDNDVNVMCAGEHDAGALVGRDDGAMLYVGRGIGAAILSAGVPQRGSRGAGAEVGLVPVKPGPQAERLEDVYSATAIARRLGMQGADALRPVRTLLRQVSAGDDAAATNVADLIDGWAYAICVLALTADPDRIALAGALCDLDDDHLGRLRAAVHARLPHPVELERAELGEAAVLRGGAAASLHHAIDSGLGGARLGAASLTRQS